MTSKEQAKYTDRGSRAEHCSNCEHYIRPEACEIVRGKISSGGWCRFWRAKRAER